MMVTMLLVAEQYVRRSMKGFSLLDIFYPKVCPVCQKTLRDNEYICFDCKDRLVYASENICCKCGKILKNDESVMCRICETTECFFVEGRSVFYYNDAIKKSLTGFKYHNRREFSRFYVKSIMEQWEEKIKLWNVDVVVPVPVHEKRLRERGYNQATIIARELCEQIDVDMDEVLIRRDRTKPQKELDRIERVRNLKEAFAVSESKMNVIKGKNILLIDDIYTTGATISACSQKLVEAGANAVFFITVATGKGV